MWQGSLSISFKYLFQDPPMVVERLTCFITCRIEYVHKVFALVIMSNCKIPIFAQCRRCISLFHNQQKIIMN